MGFLSKEDQVARAAALERKRIAAEEERRSKDAAAQRARERAAAELKVARQAIVDALFADLKTHFVRGDEVCGTYIVWPQSGQEVSWRPPSGLSRREEKRNPVFEAVSQERLGWDEMKKAQAAELAELQKLVDTVDDSFTVSLALNFENIVDSKDGPVGHYVQTVTFTLKPKD